MKYFLLPLLFCAQQLHAQPILVKDINPGAASSQPFGMIEFNGKLIFAANDSVHSYELWQANGVDASMVDDLFPGAGSSLGIGSVNQKCVVNDELYFAADEDGSGSELYKWDGVNKPVKVVDLSTSPNGTTPSYLCALNGKVYFFGLDDFYQWHLYMYSPVSGTANMVKSIDPNYYQDGFGDAMTVINNELYFSSYLEESPGFFTMQVFKYNPVTNTLNRSGALTAYSFPYSFKYLDGKVYFVHPGNNGINRLWSWDGEHQATQVNNLIYQSTLEVYAGKVYGNATPFQYGPYTVFGYDPLDGTLKGVGVAGYSSPTLISYANKFFFCNADKLWSYDGTQATSLQLSGNYNGRNMYVAGNTLYLNATSDATGEELYAYYEAPTSIKNVMEEDGVNVYPNPTNGNWNFELKNSNEQLQLIVTDMLGRVVSKQPIENKKATATAPAGGSYVYYIANAKGEALMKGKLQRL